MRENTQNESGNEGGSVTIVLPKTLADLRSFMHGYRIKKGGFGQEPFRERASIIIGGIALLGDDMRPDHAKRMATIIRRSATELAAIDPSLSWLPDWKPRVAVNAGSDR